MIGSFPARSEACQKSCKGPLEKLGCKKRKEMGAERGNDFNKKGGKVPSSPGKEIKMQICSVKGYMQHF